MERFTLGTCGEDDGMVNFICSSTKPFDIIEEKLKVLIFVYSMMMLESCIF